MNLSDNIAHHSIGDETSEFGGPEWNHLAFFPFSHFSESVIPPGFYYRIFDRVYSLFLEIIISKKPYKVCQSSASRIIH
jgi:hypothetical protein